MLSSRRFSMLLIAFVLGLTFCSQAWAEKGPAKKKAKGPTYAVQFDVPQSKEEVWNFVEMISNLGFPAYMYSEELNGATQYYAQMGVFRSVEEAADAGRLLAKKVKTKYDLVYANTNKPVVSKDDPAADVAATPPVTTAPAKAEAKPESKPEAPKTEPQAAPTSAPAAPAKAEAKPEAAPQEKAAEPAAAVAPFVAPAAPAPAPQQAKAEPEKKPDTAKKPAPKPEPEKAKAKPEPAHAAQPAVPAAPVQDKVFLVQIYSFSSLDNAKETAKNYKQRGHTVTIYKLFDNTGKEWHAVSIGLAKSYEDAARIAKKFADKEGKQPIINKVDAAFATTRVVTY